MTVPRTDSSKERERDRAGLETRGTNPRTIGYIYKVIVQSVLLYHGSESWTVKSLTETLFNCAVCFIARVARYICGRHIRLQLILRYLLEADLIILECR